MGLEAATFISQLVATNPIGASDPKSQGDDHLRLLKATLLATFPAITGAVTSTHTELNAIHGTQWLNPNLGSAAAPSYSWSGDPDTGVYRSAVNQIGFTANGAQIGVFEPSGLTVITRIFNGDGTVAIPAYTFGADFDTGFYRAAGNDFRAAAGGADIARFTTGFFQVQAGIQLTTDNGSAAAPSHSFFNDLDIGMYRAAADNIGWATGGVARLVLSNSVLSAQQAAFQILGGDGTLALPGYSYFGDPNTGLVRTSADAQSLVVNGLSAIGVQDGGGGGSTIVVIGNNGTTNTVRLNVATGAVPAGAGGGPALPATVQGYLSLNINGIVRFIPFYP